MNEETIGQRITRLMRQQHLNEYGLMAKSGMRIENIRAWKSDKHEPQRGNAARLAKALQVSTRYLYHGKEFKEVRI